MINNTDNNQAVLASPTFDGQRYSKIEEVVNLLNECAVLECGEYFSYQELPKKAVIHEFNENLKELKELFNDGSQSDDQKKEAFKALCSPRCFHEY